MTARDDIFIRIPAALDYGYDIVILYRTRPEMVAYVEFQLEILPPVHHGCYLVILPGVELYVRNRGKVVEIHIVVGKAAPEECPVCHHAQAYFQLMPENY